MIDKCCRYILRVNVIFKICYGQQQHYVVKAFAFYVPFDYQNNHIYAIFCDNCAKSCSVCVNHRLRKAKTIRDILKKCQTKQRKMKLNISKGKHMLKIKGFEDTYTEDGVALRGGVCNISGKNMVGKN